MVTFGENPTRQERTAEFTPLLRVKSPPEIDAKQGCRTKLYNDRLRGKNVSEEDSIKQRDVLQLQLFLSR